MNVPPAHFICPITMEIMVQPVVTRYGHSFEGAALMAWIETHNGDCPLTRRPLRLSDVIPHHFLTAEIKLWRAQNGLADQKISTSAASINNKGRHYMQALYGKYDDLSEILVCVHEGGQTSSTSSSPSPTSVRSFFPLRALRRKEQPQRLVAPASRRDDRRHRVNVTIQSRSL